MDYPTEKLNELIEELCNLNYMTSDGQREKLIKTYMEIAFKLGKTRGMDILLRKEENNEAVYGE